MDARQGQIHQESPVSLEQLTWVPSQYRPDERIQVRVTVEFLPRRGYSISRDIHDGGGPYQTGEFGKTLDDAILKFEEKFTRYDR